VLKLLIFYFDMQRYFFMRAGVEMVDEAHLGSQDLSDQGATPSGWVDWLVKDQEAWDWLCDYWASDEFRAVLEQNRMNRQSKPLVHHYSMDGHVRKTQRMVKKTHNFNSQLLRN
jgi:hypothetical protein